MTEEDIRKLEVKYSETKIQHICVTWFRETFPNVGPLLFAIPNGGVRTKKSGAMRGKSSVRCPLKPSDSIPLCPNNPAH